MVKMQQLAIFVRVRLLFIPTASSSAKSTHTRSRERPYYRSLRFWQQHSGTRHERLIYRAFQVCAAVELFIIVEKVELL